MHVPIGVSNWVTSRARKTRFVPALDLLSYLFSCHIIDHAERSRGFHDSARDTFQIINATTICVWAGYPLVRNHGPNPSTYSSHASA